MTLLLTLLYTRFALQYVFEKCQIIQENTGGGLDIYVSSSRGAVTDYPVLDKIDNLWLS